MKAVILCAGKSTRTYPLTIERPKPLLKVANKTIIELILDQLQNLVDEAILVVGFGKEMIKNNLGKKYGKIKIRYVDQEEPLGTGHALLQTKNFVSNDFLVLMGDTFYLKQDIEKCIKKYSILCMEVDNPKDFGVIEKRDNFLCKIIEKPEKPETNLINCALYHLNEEIFLHLEKIKKSKRKEIELTDAVNLFAKENQVHIIETKKCFMITYPWNLLDLNEYVLSQIKGKIKGKIEKNVTIKGNVIIGENTILRSGTYIEGPVIIGKNCDIGPNCYIRKYTSIGNGCRIGNAVEIKNSIIMDKTHIGHHAYVGDSIVDENVNFGAGTKIANLRHDNENVKSMIKGVLVDTGKRKFGSVIGKNVRLGINTSIYPGRKIWPNISTLPGEVVRYDKEK
ncbi:MAG: sugar phosphate nucleotidyltransferase [Candidatus Aenigmatarchaeota archaeon]